MISLTRHFVLILTLLLVYGESDAQLNAPLRVATTPDTILSLDTVATMRPDADYQPYHIRVRIFNPDSGRVTALTSGVVNHQWIERVRNDIALYPDPDWSALDSTTLLKFTDINMDGFDDLFVLDGVDPIRWIQTYDIWLFDSTTGGFQLSNEFTENVYPDYDLDDTDTTITSRWVGFPDGHEYGFNKYKVRGRHLMLIEREAQQRDDERSNDSVRVYAWKHEKLVDGVIKTVGQRTATLEELLKHEQ